MNLSIINSRAEVGIQAPAVKVEVHVAGGLPGLTIVGLPTTAVREARDRVRAALQNSGFKLPPRRITVNLAPADLPKDGARFDLAIALGILQASGQLECQLDEFEFVGELSLSGELRPVSGVLSAVMAAKLAQRAAVIPFDNAAEAALPQHPHSYCASSLLEVCNCLSQHAPWRTLSVCADSNSHNSEISELDFSQVRGQALAKRALEIAAAGRHNLLMQGPPGSGKSMLAQRLPSICPDLTDQQALQLAAIQSTLPGGYDHKLWRRIPFRSPHHNPSAAALVGGGSHPKPGEISHAHYGILFLAELPEFSRHVLEVLREPLESGEIHIARARSRVTYPSRFQLLAAMNPCPCGYLGDSNGRCHCSGEQVQRYRQRISGPLLDRIDLHINVPRIASRELLNTSAADKATESSTTIRERVIAARERQYARRDKCNAELNAQELEQDCALDKASRQLLESASERLNLSGRGLHRVLKVTRSIADLAASTEVKTVHLAEALQYRQQLCG